jgi:hypothetical protein
MTGCPGGFDDIPFYNKVLSLSEIEAIYNNGEGTKITGTETGLSWGSNCDTGIGTTLVDVTENQNGTLSSDSIWAEGGKPFVEEIPPEEEPSQTNLSELYVSVENKITYSLIILNDNLTIYDTITETINSSSLIKPKGTTTWISKKYINERESSRVRNEMYYLQIVSFVKSLQAIAVLNYEDIDSFLEENDITVSQIFADISKDAGYPISDRYIKDIS